MNLYLATGNTHKLLEFVELLCSEDLPLNLYSAAILGGMPEVEESGSTFEANAKIKVEALIEKAPLGAWILADDSGLEVDALEGAPGVYSARFAGENATDIDNMQKLIEELKERGLETSKARFKCALVIRQVEGEEHAFMGSVEGRVILEPRGNQGFGYDPLFIPDGYEQTFGELGEEIKHRFSHRARAAEKLKKFLMTLIHGS